MRCVTERAESPRALLGTPVERRLSEKAVKRWAIIWTVLLLAVLAVFAVLGQLFADPLWTFAGITSVAAASILSFPVSRIDATIVIGVAPTMLLLALSSVDTQTALFVWGIGNYLGLLLQLRNSGDAAEEASYRLGGGMVVALVWEVGHFEDSAIWWIAAPVCIGIYGLVLFVISSIRLLVVTRLGVVAGIRGFLMRRGVVAGLVISALTVLTLWLQRYLASIEEFPYSMSLTGGVVMMMLGVVVYMIGTQRALRLVESRLEGTLDGALDLPWGIDRSIDEHAVDFARMAMPQHEIELRREPGRNINEIQTPLGDHFLVAKRGAYQAPFTPQDQRVLTGVSSIADIMAEARKEQLRLSEATRTDELTGVLNYRGFREQLVLLSESPSEPFAVVYIDINNFRDVNNEFTHVVGNRVLQLLAKRLEQHVGAADVVARVGGDEFVLILTDIENEAEGHLRVAALISEVTAPFVVGEIVTITLSYGLAHATGDAGNATELIARSDERMYMSRGSGGSSAAQSSDEKNRDLVRMVEEVVRENRLGVAYQPVVDSRGDRVVALEALFRPQEPGLDDVPIQLIIHEARRLGLLTSLCMSLMETAANDMRRFGKIVPELTHVHVNIDIEQLLDAHFVEAVAQLHSTDEVDIVLELSETSLNRVHEEIQDQLRELRDGIGVKIALDDFGRDAAALRAMVDFQIDILKLDKSLAHNLASGKRAKFMEYMVLLTDRLGIQLVVEGVEDEVMRDELATSGVTHMQGYHYAKPLPADKLEKRFKQHGLRACVDP